MRRRIVTPVSGKRDQWKPNEAGLASASCVFSVRDLSFWKLFACFSFSFNLKPFFHTFVTPFLLIFFPIPFFVFLCLPSPLFFISRLVLWILIVL